LGCGSPRPRPGAAPPDRWVRSRSASRPDGTGQRSPRMPPDCGLPLDRLHPGDCLEGLARVRTGSVDLAFADPPFNIGYEYDVYDDRQSAERYLGWSRRWIAEVARVLKPDGTFWLAIGDEFAAELKVLAHRELGLTPRN